MDLKELSKVSDSVRTPQGASGSQKKIKDSKVTYANLKRKIKDALGDTEDTESAVDTVKSFLSEAPAEEVLTAAIEVISEVVDNLEEQVSDSKRARVPFKKFKVSDGYRDLRRKVKDALEETEDTESAIEAVTGFLQDQDPEQVLAASVDVLGDIIDVLESKISNESEDDPDEIYDSVTAGSIILNKAGEEVKVSSVESKDGSHKVFWVDEDDKPQYDEYTDEEFKEIAIVK